MLKTSDLDGVSTQLSNGRWVPALPLPDFLIWRRLRDAWLVFRGKAHAIQVG
jgi:hypothetical protein